MAKAKKLPSGAWNVKVYDYTDKNGKRFYKSITAATKKEAEYKAAKFSLEKKRRDGNDYGDLTVGEAAERYIKSKNAVLAEDTLNEYMKIRNNNLQTVMRTKIRNLTQEIIQDDINDESRRIVAKTGKTITPKSIANMHGFLSAVLSAYAPGLALNTTLPQKVRPDLEVPLDAEIISLLKVASGTEMEVPILLGAFGAMRRSEICALTADDIGEGGVEVSKAMIKGLRNKWIIKVPKTVSSQRFVKLPPFVMEKLPTKGKITKLNPDVITSRFWHVMIHAGLVDKKGRPKFRFHDLRHYYASVAHAIGVPDKYIMQQGGWATDHTLKNIYQKIMADKADEFTERTTNHFEHMQHEMQHEK